ncbi:MAG TPA: nucleotidyltransferase domain-containing protein [Gemmatimonadaceae bacterium]|nr:nucleotidyltransferase domain-containing protein [Gemmatimonadaceae bacterium]
MATMTLDDLVSQLRAAYGADLRAVVLYGSAAAGEHVPKRSDYNVLVLVQALPLERLRAAAAVTQAWIGAGNPPPMTMTTDEWRGSADIFPMEYADILDRHRVLYGEPPFEGMQVRPADLRLQVEQQAMGKLLQLRAGVLAAGADSKQQVDLLERSLSTIMVIFRGVLRLLGERPPADYPSLTREVAARAGFDAEPVARVVRHVRGEERLDGKSAGAALGAYLGAMEQLVQFLDRYTAASTARPG